MHHSPVSSPSGRYRIREFFDKKTRQQEKVQEKNGTRNAAFLCVRRVQSIQHKGESKANVRNAQEQ
jgi:hypothetical protein